MAPDVKKCLFFLGGGGAGSFREKGNFVLERQNIWQNYNSLTNEIANGINFTL
jgi:hypothetical protein